MRTYRVLRQLPHVDRLSLFLDCSDQNVMEGVEPQLTDVEAQLLESDVDVSSKHLHDVLINTSLNDIVAEDIFDALSFQHASRVISIRSTGAGCFRTAYVDFPYYTVARCLGRQWIQTRKPAAGHRGDEYYIVEI